MDFNRHTLSNQKHLYIDKKGRKPRGREQRGRWVTRRDAQADGEAARHPRERAGPSRSSITTDPSSIPRGCRLILGNLPTLRLSSQTLVSQASPPCPALGSLAVPTLLLSPVLQARPLTSPRPQNLLKDTSSWQPQLGGWGGPLRTLVPRPLLGHLPVPGRPLLTWPWEGTRSESAPICTLRASPPLFLPCWGFPGVSPARDHEDGAESHLPQIPMLQS